MTYTSADTCVFWDFMDFPVPDGADLHSFKFNIEKALKEELYRGRLSIAAYGAFESLCEENLFRSAEIPIAHEETDKYKRHSNMLVDMVDWALSHPVSETGRQANLMVIAKDIPEKESVFAKTLERLCRKSYNIFLVIPDEEEEPTKKDLLSVSLYVWRWGILFDGGLPIECSSDSDSDCA